MHIKKKSSHSLRERLQESSEENVLIFFRQIKVSYSSDWLVPIQLDLKQAPSFRVECYSFTGKSYPIRYGKMLHYFYITAFGHIEFEKVFPA